MVTASAYGAACSGKNQYASRADAEFAIDGEYARVLRLNQPLGKLDAYHCRAGDHWHIGHHKRETRPETPAAQESTLPTDTYTAPLSAHSNGSAPASADAPRSVFADRMTDVFARWSVELTVRDRIMGGIPRDPHVVEGWLRSKAGLSDKSEELRQFTLRTLQESGTEVSENATWEDLEALSKKMAASKHTNGFKRDERGLYLESRAVKAMLRECVNILYAGQRWGATAKGPKSFTAERVFVSPDRIHFDQMEPDGVELFIGHTSGPAGPQSNLTQYEYVEGAVLRFDLMVAEDAINPDDWARVWILAQENGLGALRSQGFGRFDVTGWQRVESVSPDVLARVASQTRKRVDKPAGTPA